MLKSSVFGLIDAVGVQKFHTPIIRKLISVPLSGPVRTCWRLGSAEKGAYGPRKDNRGRDAYLCEPTPLVVFRLQIVDFIVGEVALERVTSQLRDPVISVVGLDTFQESRSGEFPTSPTDVCWTAFLRDVRLDRRRWESHFRLLKQLQNGYVNLANPGSQGSHPSAGSHRPCLLPGVKYLTGNSEIANKQCKKPFSLPTLIKLQARCSQSRRYPGLSNSPGLQTPGRARPGTSTSMIGYTSRQQKRVCHVASRRSRLRILPVAE